MGRGRKEKARGRRRSCLLIALVSRAELLLVRVLLSHVSMLGHFLVDGLARINPLRVHVDRVGQI